MARRIVFVSPGVGHYERRDVVVGLTGDNRLVEVLSGLVPGEVVDNSPHLSEPAKHKLLSANAETFFGLS